MLTSPSEEGLDDRPAPQQPTDPINASVFPNDNVVDQASTSADGQLLDGLILVANLVVASDLPDPVPFPNLDSTL